MKSVLFVHAHPDDECIPTGVTIAKYAAEGARVTVVTCTLGEAGEIVDEELAYLAEQGQDALGAHRRGEMEAAAKELGLTDHRWLGGPGRWRDSGMIGTPENDDPRCFWQADFDEAVGELVAVIRETRPQVAVTYDSNGDYGHPDHIQAHRVTHAAVERAADASYGTGEPWQVAKVYSTAFPKSVLRLGFEYFKASGDDFFAAYESADEMPFGVPDEVVTTRIAAPEHVERKFAAMRAHRSQIKPDGVFFVLPPELAAVGMGEEYFILLRGEPGPATDERGWEPDLFSGIAFDHSE
ncbi:MAG TPA: N-acetyl-1-D-myo-inositol-2-amino-2-deoxy-alpha-D-glucopyranoside deacetylase [Frankiaceae bacterium]|nr:N-acetyl-1-D-myo-inositol-2-amino-2-deoxy-alpha-D-glucopyranoside deacetylase [Frankiaceae bacterium]